MLLYINIFNKLEVKFIKIIPAKSARQTKKNIIELLNENPRVNSLKDNANP